MKLARWSIDARDEARAASQWYREQSPYAAEKFEQTVRAALAEVCATPRRWPVWRATAYRRYVVPHFPYSIVYRCEDDRVFVLALLHHSRDPDRRFPP